MNESTLEQQIQRLTDIEDIKLFKHHYAELCDNGYPADELAELFVEDGVWAGGALGHADGREEIRQMFAHMTNRVDYALHTLMNPQIVVNGDRATGKWYLFQPMVVADSTQAVWLIAKYDDVYVRRDGRWLYQTLNITAEAFSPYEDGFGKTRFAEVPQ